MRERSAVRTMLQKKAESDRTVKDFPAPFQPVATPYGSKVDFSPVVREACISASHGGMLGSSLRLGKVIFLGDVAVGKTCLVNRFCNRIFDCNYKATIGVDFEVERFDILNIPYNLQIWDTAGQERFKCIATSYYRAAHAIVLVFDVTSPASLVHCTQWLHDALEANVRSPIKPLIFLVATKKDLLGPVAYSVVAARATRKAIELGAELWSVSARTGDNVQQFFFRLAALTFDAAVLRELYEQKNKQQAPAIGTHLASVKLSTKSDPLLLKHRKKCNTCV